MRTRTLAQFLQYYLDVHFWTPSLFGKRRSYEEDVRYNEIYEGWQRAHCEYMRGRACRHRGLVH